VNRLDADQIDRQLGDWLRHESAIRAPSRLVEDVFARTSRTSQARPPLLRGLRRSSGVGERTIWTGHRVGSFSRTAFAGALTILLVIVVVGVALRPSGPGPGATGSPKASLSPTPSPSLTPTHSPLGSVTAPPSPTPIPTTVGALSAQRLSLGIDAGPISVTKAFGSIWVADIHANDVRRYAPATFAELARIPAPGAAWFAQADDALWVTNQTGVGLHRIDPTTNAPVALVGNAPPCGAPVIAFGSLWQSACDGNVILRIDPATNTVLKTFPAQGHSFLVLAGGRLITGAAEGLAALDPDTGAFTTIPNQAAVAAGLLESDGSTVWALNQAGFARIDPIDGRTIAGFSYPDAQAVTFAGDHAWLTVRGVGVLEVDLATNQVTRTLPMPGAPLVALEADGVLWVTDFTTSALWRIGL
jgi:DNA-binding beta-propeller fold protein YncE